MKLTIALAKTGQITLSVANAEQRKEVGDVSVAHAKAETVFSYTVLTTAGSVVLAICNSMQY